MTDSPSRRAILGAGGLLLAGLAGCDSSGPTPSTTPASDGAATPSSSTSAPSTSAVPSPIPAGPVPELVNGPRTRAEVALTFHGAGPFSIASSLLAIAERADVQVTVMAIGSWLTSNRAFARDLLAAGHELGNHTWTHPYLDDLSESQIRDEIRRCRDLVLDLTDGVQGQFRPSNGQHWSARTRTVAGGLGYPYCLSYDVDSLDWTDPGAATVIEACRQAQNGSILSLHFEHQDTVDALPTVIADLKDRGLRMVTASALLRP